MSNSNKRCSLCMTPKEQIEEYDKRTAKMILDAVTEGAGHLYTSEEISWALQVSGDLPLPNNQY